MRLLTFTYKFIPHDLSIVLVKKNPKKESTHKIRQKLVRPLRSNALCECFWLDVVLGLLEDIIWFNEGLGV